EKHVWADNQVLATTSKYLVDLIGRKPTALEQLFRHEPRILESGLKRGGFLQLRSAKRTAFAQGRNQRRDGIDGHEGDSLESRCPSSGSKDCNGAALRFPLNMMNAWKKMPVPVLSAVAGANLERSLYCLPSPARGVTLIDAPLIPGRTRNG